MREAPCRIPQISRHRYRAPANIAANFTAEEIRRVYQDASAAVRKHAGAFKEPSASVATKPEFYLKLVRLILQNRVRIALR